MVLVTLAFFLLPSCIIFYGYDLNSATEVLRVPRKAFLDVERAKVEEIKLFFRRRESRAFIIQTEKSRFEPQIGFASTTRRACPFSLSHFFAASLSQARHIAINHDS